MTADVFAALQAFQNIQTIQTTLQETPSGETDSRAGLFASLMNECIAEGEAAGFSEQVLVIPEEIPDPQMMAFTATKTFPQSVMNILAGEAEITPDTPSPEVMHENIQTSQEKPDDDVVIWPEDEAEQISAPELADEDMTPESPEPSRAEDISRENPEPSRAEDIPPEVHEPALAENTTHKPTYAPAKTDTLKASHDTEDTQESEEPQEIPEVSAEMAGLAGVVNLQPQNTPLPQNSAQPEIQDTLTQPERSAGFSQPSRQRRVQPETPQAPHEQQETPEAHEARADISVNREAFSENDDDGDSDAQQQNPNPQSQNHNTTQNQTQTQTRKTDSRNIKTEAPSQNTAPESRRTESHSDFGAYFEGVLNSRRSTARVSEPMPLNLRSAENFSQAATLRDGLTNVVRFIRADGVQKARVVVDPPALGRVSVELTSGTSGVEASIKVASEQIRQLVQDQISQLRMNLSQQGVQVAEFTVDVQQDNSGNHGQQGQEHNSGSFGFVDDSEDDEAEDFRIDLNEGLLYWVA